MNTSSYHIYFNLTTTLLHYNNLPGIKGFCSNVVGVVRGKLNFLYYEK